MHYTTLHDTTLQLQLHYFILQYTRLHYTMPRYSTPHYSTVQYTTLITPHHNYNCNYTTVQLQLTTTTPLHYNYNYTYNYNCTTPRYIQQLWWGDHCNHCNHPRKHNSNHLSLCHAWVTTTNPSYFWSFRHRLVRYYWNVRLYDVICWFAIFIQLYRHD